MRQNHDLYLRRSGVYGGGDCSDYRRPAKPAEHPRLAGAIPPLFRDCWYLNAGQRRHRNTPQGYRGTMQQDYRGMIGRSWAFDWVQPLPSDRHRVSAKAKRLREFKIRELQRLFKNVFWVDDAGYQRPE